MLEKFRANVLKYTYHGKPKGLHDYLHMYVQNTNHDMLNFVSHISC